ncbi:alpha/beta hydrolase family protein [Antrihabitans cavernicola]|uniref:Lysophospholipase n=1 Tax=Antrihabitans cavernicola TaxID=2495913 RepID=A0A5A7S753_9NOCA|nr:alpha/beta fold hydrolase [Spelaeibacter cavernicola]KAA0018398.1 lysophospholipase [Spelaeibacter cavernicola]
MSSTALLTVDRFPFPDMEARAGGDASVTSAALRQFTLHRLLAYGLEAGDALRLLELAGEGRSWQRSALALADQLSTRAENSELPRTRRSQARLYGRASALQRISQAMVLDNTDDRKRTYAAAAANFTRARADDSRYEHVVIDTVGGPIAAWVITPDDAGPHPVVLVHGGVDGWSMDWEGLALALVDEGMCAVVIDGPGQGETRFTHQHYLTPDWLDAYLQVCGFLLERAAGMPVATVGNSMAGALVLLIASRYPVFSAVCSNGPVGNMAAQLARPTYARKLASFCGDNPTDDQVHEAFESMTLTADRITSTSPFLLLQGDADPMVSVDDGTKILESVPSADKRMALFEGGEHVINRYPGDKHHLISTWLRDRMDPAIAAAK